jgi:Calx-beta domain-containing protein/hemolysin type calcium-binding protein
MHTKRKSRRRSLAPLGVVALTIAAVVVASAAAGTIRGTPRADTLRGTGAADKLYGNGGNDKLYGLAGNDYLNGGAGNDVVAGGPGVDTLVCGPGRDTAVADGSDRIAADCETVQGVPKQALSVANVSQPEGNSGSQPATFTVSLAKASPLRVSVAYATANGTATAGTDYTATSGTLVFAPGQTTKTVAVPVVGDTAYESDETFSFTLSNAVNATLGTATATGTITNDDAAPANPGHYNGPISSGGNIDYDVAADGHTVTGMTMLLYISCDNGLAGLLSVGWPGTVPIQPDLSFDASGSGQDITVKLTGKFDNATSTASGALQVHLNYQGASCDTGAVTWTAARK